MKSRANLLNALIMSELLFGQTTPIEVDRETIEEKNERLKKKREDINRSNGLTLFKYGDNEVWALNKKTADKKALKNRYV